MFVKYPPTDSASDTNPLAKNPPPSYNPVRSLALFNKASASPSAPSVDEFNIIPNAKEYAMLELLRKNDIRSPEQLEAILDHFAQSQQFASESQGFGKGN
jgi:hypothetical protein